MPFDFAHSSGKIFVPQIFSQFLRLSVARVVFPIFNSLKRIPIGYSYAYSVYVSGAFGSQKTGLAKP
jgi:hypothetical protein